MPDSRRQSAAPWITAGALGVVLAALLVVVFAVLVPDRRNRTVGALTSSETQVVQSATTDAVNVVSYRRAQFEADYQRALAGVTGALKTELTSRKATTLQAMTQGKFDLSAKVLHAALEGPGVKGKTSSYVVLVTLDGYKTTEPTQPTTQNLKVTVVKVKGKWLANDVTLVQVN